jgi:hypothetical protein
LNNNQFHTFLKENNDSKFSQTKKVENASRKLVIYLSAYQRHVCCCVSACEGTASTSKNTCVYVDSRANYGDIFAAFTQALLVLDYEVI